MEFPGLSIPTKNRSSSLINERLPRDMVSAQGQNGRGEAQEQRLVPMVEACLDAAKVIRASISKMLLQT